MNDIAIELSEHEVFAFDKGSNYYQALIDRLNKDDYNPSNPSSCLGLEWGNRSRTEIKAGYFIGVKWIEEGKSAICIKPKIENLDFLSMFMSCLDNECLDVANQLGRIYQISFKEKPISVSNQQFELTPMLIIHFLKLVDKIVRQGIKSDYTKIEENLNGRIKGKIEYGKTIKHNHAIGRSERVVCNYQDFTTDCLENRILKRALLFVDKYLKTKTVSTDQELRQIIAYSMAAFRNVSDSISTQNIKQFRINPIYKEYSEALKIAKMIFQRFGYSLDTVNENVDMQLPPFWIDMSLLFELYVYSQLKSNYHHEVTYHISTTGNEIDFVKHDESLIIDTKYSLWWEERINHDNVRQLSGYARNTKLRKKILKEDDNDTAILPCLIIYPDVTNGVSMTSTSILSNAISVDSYLKFSKLPIMLPLK